MKMNKLAAGALALALGFGAVAPSLAVEAKSGTQLTAEAYNEQLAEANKFYLKRKEAMEAVEAAKARIKAAEAAVKAAEKAYKDAKDDELTKIEQLQEDLAAAKVAEQKAKDKPQAEYPGDDDNAKKKAKEDAEAAAAAKVKKLSDELALYKDAKGNTLTKNSEVLRVQAGIEKGKVAAAAEKVEKARKALADNKDDSKKEKLEQDVIDANNALLAANAKYEEKLAELGKALEKEKEEADKLYVGEKLSPKKQALVELVKAQNELSAANGAYGTAVATEKAAKARYEKEYGLLETRAMAAGYIVKIENDKIVVKPSIKDEKEFKKDNITELKRAREEALTAIKAVKLLKELSPEKIKNVEAKLNKLVEKNEALVKKADEKLAAAKVAFIATAYADETADDTDALIKELDSTTSEIKELIKDKPEEEKKPEEKKPEEKTPSKKAGNNARTGIAGVAGVAGILAAASVAYAASKRD